VWGMAGFLIRGLEGDERLERHARQRGKGVKQPDGRTPTIALDSRELSVPRRHRSHASDRKGRLWSRRTTRGDTDDGMPCSWRRVLLEGGLVASPSLLQAILTC
jgi:hypothetical protein